MEIILKKLKKFQQQQHDNLHSLYDVLFSNEIMQRDKFIELYWSFDLIFIYQNRNLSQIEIFIVIWGCNSLLKHKENKIDKTHLHVIYQESFPEIFSYVHNQSNKIQVLLHILARKMVYNSTRVFDINLT